MDNFVVYPSLSIYDSCQQQCLSFLNTQQNLKISHNDHFLYQNKECQSTIQQIHFVLKYQIQNLVSSPFTNSSEIFYRMSIPTLIRGLVYQAAQPEVPVMDLH